VSQSRHRAGAQEAIEIVAVVSLLLLAGAGWLGFAFGMALVCVWRPPVCGGRLGILLACLAILPLAALVPPLGHLPWAAALPDRPSSVAPQPLVLLSAWPGFFAGLAYLWWICGRSRPGFVGARQTGVLLLAIIASLLLVAGRWESGAWRGPWAGVFEALFATRNQAGGYAAVALAGCAMKAVFSRNRRPLWALGAVCCAIPLATLGSRGAPAAALIGCAVGWSASALGRGGMSGNWRSAAMASLGIFLVGALAVVFWPHAALVERFGTSGVSGGDFRLAVQRDAWGLLAAFPLTGVGLGNFDVAFPFFRSISAAPSRAFHPESDWLWLATEAGLLAGILAWGVSVMLALRLWKSEEPGELAVGLAAMAAVAAHGLLDVPAHSSPIFALACALAGTGGPLPGRTSRLLSWAVALTLALASCLALRWARIPRPEVFRPDRPMSIPDSVIVRRWLVVHPMDSEVLELEVHRAIQSGDDRLASGLMGRLFLLEPFSTEPPSRVFEALRGRGAMSAALISARAILERTPLDRRAGRLEELLRASSSLPELQSGILSIPPPTAACQAVRIAAMGGKVSPGEFGKFFELAARPGDPGVPGALAAAALESGEDGELDRAGAIPALAGPAVRVRARRLAGLGNFEAACEVAATSPGLTSAQILSSPGIPRALLLAFQDLREGNPARARALLHASEPRNATSRELWYLLGCAEWQSGSPDHAWIAFEKFLDLGQTATNASHERR
jgi:O-antigen ligase